MLEFGLVFNSGFALTDFEIHIRPQGQGHIYSKI